MKEKVKAYQQTEKYKKYKSEYNKNRYLTQMKEQCSSVIYNSPEIQEKVYACETTKELRELMRKLME